VVAAQYSIVNAMATRGICADVLRVVMADHTLVVGETVLDELRCVLRRKLGAPAETVEAVDAFLRRHGTVIDRVPPLGIEIRDPCDVAVLEQAVAGQVAVLVTGARDLLEIEQAVPIRIVSPRGLWEDLRS